MVDERDKSVRPSIFSNKGTAAPSPEGRHSPENKAIVPKPEPKETTEILKKSSNSPQANGLSGLIKRANPVLNQPSQPFQPSQPTPRPVQSGGFGKSQKFKTPPATDDNPVPEIIKKSSPSRHQLTVRVEAEKFKELERMSKLSGRTYQDILSRALNAYVEDIDD